MDIVSRKCFSSDNMVTDVREFESLQVQTIMNFAISLVERVARWLLGFHGYST